MPAPFSSEQGLKREGGARQPPLCDAPGPFAATFGAAPGPAGVEAPCLEALPAPCNKFPACASVRSPPPWVQLLGALGHKAPQLAELLAHSSQPPPRQPWVPAHRRGSGPGPAGTQKGGCALAWRQQPLGQSPWHVACRGAGMHVAAAQALPRQHRDH